MSITNKNNYSSNFTEAILKPYPSSILNIANIQDAITYYFNVVLKNSLNYVETYSVIFD